MTVMQVYGGIGDVATCLSSEQHIFADDAYLKQLAELYTSPTADASVQYHNGISPAFILNVSQN